VTSPAESPLVLVGWDFRHTPVSLRERLAFSPDRIREALTLLKREGLLAESVIVSTCNRSEIYGVAGGRGSGDESADRLTEFVANFQQLPEVEIGGSRYRLSGADAARHLFRVAAGLESLALGEDQILAQVREAFRLASGAGATRSVLNRLFQKAFETGKRVRSETGLGTRPTSIPGVAMELAQKIYEDLARRSFLIVGAGETASIFYDLLKTRGASRVEVVNRSFERAERLCRTGGTARRWDELPARLPKADIVVAATSSPEPVLRLPDVREAISARRGEPVFFLDLGVPRNVDPGVSRLDNVFLYAVDDLQTIADSNRRERERDIPAAESIVEEALGDFHTWLGALAVVPTLTALRRRFETVRAEEFDAPLARLAHLDDSDRERIRLIAQSMVRSLLRQPTDALKEEPDPYRRLDRAEAVRHLFGLDDRPEE
jgi:glutamyl-tRNA reductase